MATPITDQIKGMIIDLKSQKERVKTTSQAQITEIEAKIAELQALTVSQRDEDLIGRLGELGIKL